MYTCPICLENINDNFCTKTECGHNYHHLCILKWLSRYEKRCPLCNGNIIIKDFDNIYLNKKYIYQNFCNANIIINLVKIKINDLDYFLSDIFSILHLLNLFCPLRLPVPIVCHLIRKCLDYQHATVRQTLPTQ